MDDNKDDRLLRYLELCQRMYERMERDGTWLWTEGDSQGDTVSPSSTPSADDT